MSTLLYAVYSRPTSKIDLTFDNKVVVTFPASKLSFLKGLDQFFVDKMVIRDKGTVLYWPEIDKEVKVSEVLEQLLGG